jgi:hypothetical protein
MLTYSHRPIGPQLIAALEQIDNPAPEVRDAALKTISALLPGMTLAEFLSDVMARAAAATPWWQLKARALLARHRLLLSPAGIEFCERIASRRSRPTSEDARKLRGLDRALSGV